MGRMKESMDEDDELGNLPPEAFEDWGSRGEISKHWLTTATPADQKTAMHGWFRRNFYYPAGISKSSLLRKHIYTEGGPFSPRTILNSEFSRYVDDKLIKQVISQLELVAPDGWVLIPNFEDSDDYDELLDVDVGENTAPNRELKTRLCDISEMLSLSGRNTAKRLNTQLAFAATITALESFLWETVAFAVEHDEGAARRIITQLKHFKEQNLKLGDIFEKYDSIKTLVKSYLQDTVWHKADTVGERLRVSLQIRPPSFARFKEAVIKRHDIVHRSGRTKDGEHVTVTIGEIRILMKHVEDFADELKSKIEARQVELAVERTTARLVAVSGNAVDDKT